MTGLQAADLGCLLDLGRALVAAWPDLLETGFTSSRLVQRHPLPPGQYYHVTFGGRIETGTRQDRREWFMTVLALGGKSFPHLPEGAVVGAEIDARDARLLRHFLARAVARHIPGGPMDPVPAGLDQMTVRTIRNALKASGPDHCATMLAGIRMQLMQRGPAAMLNPASYRSILGRLAELRAALALDVHLPAAFMVAAALVEAATQGLPDQPASPAQLGHVIAPLLDPTVPLDRIAPNIASVVLRLGAAPLVTGLVQRYRDEIAAARELALDAADNQAMLRVLYDALPMVHAANGMAQMLAQQPGFPVWRNIARQTVEELVRFADAFSLHLRLRSQSGAARRLSMILAAQQAGPESIAKLRQYWEGNFSFPRPVLDRLLS